MAKKKETTSLIEALLEYQELKSIDRNTLIAVMEDSLRNVLSKMFGSDDTFDVIINVEKKGDFEIWRTRHVVADDDFVDEVREVPLSEAQRVDPDIAVGEDFVDAVDFNSFGRRAVINLRQALASKILELQKEHFYHSFVGRVGELVSAEVYQVWKREALLIDDEGNELLMPKSEQIPGDFFRKGETVRAVIERVENENSNPKVILSRVSPEFLKRLLELEDLACQGLTQVDHRTTAEGIEVYSIDKVLTDSDVWVDTLGFAQRHFAYFIHEVIVSDHVARAPNLKVALLLDVDDDVEGVV